MSVYDRLIAATAPDRARFLDLAIVRTATREGVPAAVYLDFLGQAYHHVRRTCHLLTFAASRCGDDLDWLRDGFLRYVDEESGHEAWILEDIAALGGDAEAVRHAQPRIPCKVMVGYAHYSIAELGPVAMLGMVHVLEGMSVLLAQKAAEAIRARLRAEGGGGGFRYLTSHGALDHDHVAFFRLLVDRLEAPAAQDLLIDSAKVMYSLYGDLFRDVAARAAGDRHAA